MQDLISQSNNSPPEDLARNLVELLTQLIEDSRAAFAVKGSSVVISNDDLLLALELPSVELVQLLICFIITRAFLPNSSCIYYLLVLGRILLWLLLILIIDGSLDIRIKSTIQFFIF